MPLHGIVVKYNVETIFTMICEKESVNMEQNIHIQLKI